MKKQQLNIVSWHPVLTDHQAYTLQSIHQSGGCNLSVFQLLSSHPDRVGQGWTNSYDAEAILLKNIPGKGWFNFILKKLSADKTSVHLFNSPFENPKLIAALLMAVILKVKFCLVSEPFSPISKGYQSDNSRFLNHLKAKLRPFVYQFYGFLIRRQVLAVFAISSLAVSQYEKMGISVDRIYPFGYFVPLVSVQNPRINPKPEAPPKIVYVGSLIERKGLDLLIAAIKSINQHSSTNALLDVFGPGNPIEFDFQSPGIHYKGTIPFGTTQNVVGQYDLVVVPSRYDGWGVVVNESLMAGVPVICSSQVGASALLKHWGVGDVFASDSIEDLKLKLTDYITNPKRLESEKLVIVKLMHHLFPETAGKYVLDVINHSIDDYVQDRRILGMTKRPIRVHLTNVTGLGAVRVAQALLPALENQIEFSIEELHLPNHGMLCGYKSKSRNTKCILYKRFLPNSLSRVLECTFFAKNLSSATPLLVLGDIPLRCKTKQTVFVQTPLLLKSSNSGSYFGAIKYFIARSLFKLNLRFASQFIVQTGVMKSELITSYPELVGIVDVIPQPVPDWVMDSKLKRTRRLDKSSNNLSLFYPASIYPHKNHQLLSQITLGSSKTWPITELVLTIPIDINPNQSIDWIKCTGELNTSQVLDIYSSTDALLFLSLSESYGLPLIEAMWLGLPIICPNLAYAKYLCGDQAIYFNPTDINSLLEAINQLKTSLDAGWWPDWTEMLKSVPSSWDEVARKNVRNIESSSMISIITVCYNAEKTIKETLDSVAAQDYENKQHIVVDGASSDETINILCSASAPITYTSKADNGIYDAMNNGLQMASGEIIGMLNADDFYADKTVLSQVAAVFDDPSVDACYADLLYVDQNDTNKVIRYWKSCNYKDGLFENGWMPAHPTFFVRRSIYEKYGNFDLSFPRQADFDLTMRFLAVHKIKSVYIPKIWIKMRMGGVSNNSIRGILKGNLEAYKSCRKNGLKVGYLFIVRKILSRIPQYFSKPSHSS